MKKKFEKIVKEDAQEICTGHFECEPTEKPIATSAYILVVKSPFGPYKKGDQIHDSSEINEILGNHQSHMVIKITRKVG